MCGCTPALRRTTRTSRCAPVARKYHRLLLRETSLIRGRQKASVIDPKATVARTDPMLLLLTPVGR